ncbi:MAG: transcriptional regulator [Bradyrhizobium sp.]|nr:transcriptional regulator [Bradyrhizobium sp.]
MSEDTSLKGVELATEVTITWLGNQNNRVAADEVPAFLRAMHATVIEPAGGAPPPPQAQTRPSKRSPQR